MRRASTRQHAIDILLEFCLVAFGADSAAIYELHEDELVFTAGKGLSAQPPFRCPADGSNLLSRAMKTTQVMQVDINHVTSQDGRGCEVRDYFVEQGFHSLLISSLRTADVTIGVLFVGLCKDSSFSITHQQLLDAFSEAAGNTLHRFMVTEQLEKTVSNRDRELQMLYDLNSIAAETPERDQLLKKSLHRILHAVNCPSGVIHLIDKTDYLLKLICAEDFPEVYLYYMDLSGGGLQLWHKVFQEQATVNLRHIPDHPPFPDVALRWRSYYSYLGVPIKVKGRTAGVLSLFGDERIFEDSLSIQLAISAAAELGQSIESIDLRKQAEDVIIFRERQRLARNLHDSVSQSLYALVISADVSEKLLRIKDFSGLKRELHDIGIVALQGLKEMRLLLYEYQSKSLEYDNLENALSLRLNSVESRAGIQADLAIERSIDLSPQTAGEIYRIVIEALNNSLKHSNATHIRISLCARDRNLVLEVKDDGCGFDPSKVDHNGGMGLKSMYERARILSGELNITSAPGKGTLVHLLAPLSRNK